MTVAHWRTAASRKLSEKQSAKLLKKASEVLGGRLHFADAIPELCGNRFLIVAHVASSFSSSWRGIQQMARSALGIAVERRRLNFHMSVDRVLSSPRLSGLPADWGPPAPVPLAEVPPPPPGMPLQVAASTAASSAPPGTPPAPAPLVEARPPPPPGPPLAAASAAASAVLPGAAAFHRVLTS